MKFHITKEHEEDILNALKVFPLHTTYLEKSKTHSFGSNWFYFSEQGTVCTLNISTTKFEYNIRIAPNNKCIILVDDDFSSFDNTDNICSCKFYLEEDEYFMDSTVKTIPIPYSILKRSYEFLQYVQKEFR